MKIIASILAVINLAVIMFVYFFNFIFIPSGPGAGFTMLSISAICLFWLSIINIFMHLVLSIKFLKNPDKTIIFPKDILYLSYCGSYFLFGRNIFLTLLGILLLVISSFTANLIGFILMPLIFFSIKKAR